jgi:hypothetical protein
LRFWSAVVRTGVLAWVSCAAVACVGDDTVAAGNAGTQGGSGPPPASYDATVDGAGSEDAAEDAADATSADAGDAGGPDATNDTSDVDGDASTGVSDAGSADVTESDAASADVDVSDAASADEADGT